MSRTPTPLPPEERDRWHRWAGLPEALGLLFAVCALCGAALFALSILLSRRGLGVLVAP